MRLRVAGENLREVLRRRVDLHRNARVVVARVAESRDGRARVDRSFDGGVRGDEAVVAGLSERVVLVEAHEVLRVGYAKLREVFDRGARLLGIARANVEYVARAGAGSAVAEHLRGSGECPEKEALRL